MTWDSEKWEVMLVWAFVVLYATKIYNFNCEVIDKWTIMLKFKSDLISKSKLRNLYNINNFKFKSNDHENKQFWVIFTTFNVE